MSTATSNPSAVSSASRAFQLRMRPDVNVLRQSYQGRDYWVIKDPISLKYYRFEEEEYALLKMFNGQNSAEHIKRMFDFEFAPQRITLQELYQFAGMLYRSCLLISESPGQGVELRHRAERKTWQQRKAGLSNILAIRFRGFDPDPILNVLNGWTWWLFCWPTFLLACLLWLAAGGLLVTHIEQFSNKLPRFHEFFAAGNWIWLAVVMAVTKVIHEFGHGLACKRFGGQCHEMGVMLLVLTPCLYCNVSDSWTLPSKWRRAAIAAAGMYVELILAAMAVFVWWFSQPGIVNQLALNIVFVSSVSTILFNGNPLLRYDGYYILSDLLEIPNLRQKATSILQRQWATWALGIPSRPDPFLPNRHKWLFALYSIAAVAYRWLITFSIFWFLYSLLEPYGAGVIGRFIALFAIWGLVGMPILQAYRFFTVPGRFGTVNRTRATSSAIILLLCLSGILLIPIPHYVRCPFTIEPQAAENVYVDVPGTIRSVHVKQGEYVRREQPLLNLKNDELALQVAQLQGAIRISKTRYDTLLRALHSAGNDRDAAEDLELARSELESAQADLQQRQQELQKLQIRAELSGWLIAPPTVPRKKSDSGELETWHGDPLERRNLGSFLDHSTVVARIVPDTRWMEAVLMVDQNDIEFVRRGQPVELFPTLLPGTTIHASTETISNVRLKSVPKALASPFGGDVVTIRDESGRDVPQSATFQVAVPFENVNDLLVDGGTGRARIRTGSQTIGSRIWRLTQKTFRFDL